MNICLYGWLCMQTTESENWVVLSTTHQHVLRAFCGRESSCDGFDPTQKVKLWGKQQWLCPDGGHSKVDLAVNAVVVARSTREWLTDKNKFNTFINKQALLNAEFSYFFQDRIISDKNHTHLDKLHS